MEIFAYIPARGGSKGIKMKNIIDINGKPLLSYTIEAAKRSNATRIFVSTDCKHIEKVATEEGVKPEFLRPVELANDKSSIEDGIRDVLKKLWESEKYSPDLILLLQPTSPMRTYEDINNCIEMFKNDIELDSLISVSEPMEHPADMVYFDQGEIRFLLDGIEPGKTQRQSFPKCFFVNGAIYLFKLSHFNKTGSRFGGKNTYYLMEQDRSIDIDTLSDLKIVRALMSN